MRGGRSGSARDGHLDRADEVRGLDDVRGDGAAGMNPGDSTSQHWGSASFSAPGPPGTHALSGPGRRRPGRSPAGSLPGGIRGRIRSGRGGDPSRSQRPWPLTIGLFEIPVAVLRMLALASRPPVARWSQVSGGSPASTVRSGQVVARPGAPRVVRTPAQPRAAAGPAPLAVAPQRVVYSRQRASHRRRPVTAAPPALSRRTRPIRSRSGRCPWRSRPRPSLRSSTDWSTSRR